MKSVLKLLEKATLDNIQIGKFISELRKEKGMTQEEFATQVGVNQRTVSRWETGKNMPDYSVLSEICDTLGISISELLSGKRTEGENISKTDAAVANMKLAEIMHAKDNGKKIIGAVISFVLTIVCIVLLYTSAFDLTRQDIFSSSKLENVIKEYWYYEDIDFYKVIPKVLRIENADEKVYVLFSQENAPGNSGIMVIEKGVFGRYRISSSILTGNKKIDWDKTKDGKYICIWNVNNLPRVATYELAAIDPVSSETKEVYYRGAYSGEPFLIIVENKNYDFWLDIKYFDEAGKEISRAELSESMGVDLNDDGGVSAKVLAESFLIYAYEIIIAILGLIFIRYFLSDIHRKN